MENEDELIKELVAGCLKQDKKCQKLLYKSYYGFAMGICLRYAGSHYEATKVMNKGFINVFSNIPKYDLGKPFKTWLGRIMINTSIDYHRSHLKEFITDTIENIEETDNRPLPDNLGYKELLATVQQLPQRLRLVFNLHAIDGYTYEEIGEILGKSEDTCKWNLFKARELLRKMIDDGNQLNSGSSQSPGFKGLFGKI